MAAQRRLYSCDPGLPIATRSAESETTATRLSVTSMLGLLRWSVVQARPHLSREVCTSATGRHALSCRSGARLLVPLANTVRRVLPNLFATGSGSVGRDLKHRGWILPRDVAAARGCTGKARLDREPGRGEPNRSTARSVAPRVDSQDRRFRRMDRAPDREGRGFESGSLRSLSGTRDAQAASVYIGNWIPIRWDP